MPAPPARTEISDTYPNPSNAVARSGFGKLYDYAVGLLGTTGNAEEARTALGLPTGQASSDGTSGYYKFPSWMGGLIVQWYRGNVTADAGGSASVTLPITNPTMTFMALAIPVASWMSARAYTCYVNDVGIFQTAVTVFFRYQDGAGGVNNLPGNIGVSLLAIGK